MRLKRNRSIHYLSLLVTAVIIFMSFPSSAQPIQGPRYEKKQENGDNGYSVISLKKEGLAIVKNKEKYREGKRLWEMILLDTALNERHTAELELESRINLIGYEYVSNELYLLFRKTDSDINNFLLLQTNLTTFSTTSYTIKQQLNFKITHFTVAGGSTIFGGYVNREPAVFLYELKSDQTKIVPGFFLSDTELLDLRLNQNNTFNVLIMERGFAENKKLVIRTFDEWGNLILEDIMKIPAERAILSGITSTLEHDEFVILGTWGLVKSNQASGFYSANVDPFSEQSVQFYDFGELNHFFEYLGPKKAEKEFAKAKRSRIAGKIPDFKANVNVIKISEHENGFSLLSEVYNPSSNLNSSPYWNNYPSPYGNPYAYGYNPYGFNSFGSRNYNSPYSSYSTTQNSDVSLFHSSLVFFDLQGRIKEDYGFKLNSLKQPSLDQASDFTVRNKNNLSIAFKNEENINIKTWSGNSIIQDTLKIKMKNPADKLRQEHPQNTGLREWYSNRFYVWGYESIKDLEKNDDQARYIFYINKLEIK